MPQSVLVIGGTGAQGSVVVRALAQTGRYQIKILTRSLQSAQAKALAELSQVSLLEGDCFSVPDLERAFAGIDSCFINTNGFAIGEKNEIFWSIRMYEIAHFAGVKHFVYGGLEYISRKAGFNPKYRCHHYDAKGKFGDFLASQPTSPMNWSVISSGPYMESLADSYRPQANEEGTYIFNLPLDDGAMPLICLDDLGTYTRWLFENPTKSAGLNLEIATVHTFTEPAVQIRV